MLNSNHLPCPCGKSSDAYSVQNGWGKCHRCGQNFNEQESTKSKLNTIVPLRSKSNDEDFQASSSRSTHSVLVPVPDNFHPLTERGISKATAEKYKVSTDFGDNDNLYRYPIFKDGVHVANKVRHKDKKFHWEGDTTGIELFGQHVFPAGCAKSITVLEGQDDALAAFELQGSKYPCVSVHSSGSALKDCKTNYEYLDSFQEIVLCFDADDPGKEAAKKVAPLFKPGKVRIVYLTKHKDANDYLRAKDQAAFVKQWWDAPVFTPDGLLMGGDILDKIINRPEQFTVPYPWESMNKMTYGVRLSELVLMMADTGAGKTTVFKEWAYHILKNPEVKDNQYSVGFLHLEEPVHDTALGLMSIHNSKPYHLPDTDKTKEELTKAHSEVFGDNRTVFYDSFGANDIDVIISKIRHMVALGCKYIFLDHLSIIVSDGEGDERKLLDSISTKLKTLTIELDIAVFAVIHTNRQGLARGSAGPEKVANLHLTLERNKKEADPWRRNVLKITIEKNRFCGKTGPCSWLYYNNETGRVSEMSQEEIDRYEAGETLRDDEQW